jgi:hypothetical protein
VDEVSSLNGDEAGMNPRYPAAKLFFVLAALFALVGAAVFRRGVIGTGLTGTDYLNPLFWITIPRLIPFGAFILSMFFGLVYYGVEKKFKRPANIPLTLIHLVSFVLAVLAHATLVRFWWTVLGQENTLGTAPPSWASLLTVAAVTVSLFAFGLNILWSMSGTPRVTSNPR